MTTADLEVVKAYPNDVARGIARLDPDTLLELELSPGDVVALEGGDTTTAKVWRADRQDWGLQVIRLDRFTRRNAGVDRGETVTVRKADPDPLEEVVVAPVSRVELGSDAAGTLQRELLKRPVLDDDLLPVQQSAHPFLPTPDDPILFVAEESTPEGIGLVGTETVVRLWEDPADVATDGLERTAAAHEVTVDAVGVELEEHGLFAPADAGLSETPAVVEGRLRHGGDGELVAGSKTAEDVIDSWVERHEDREEQRKLRKTANYDRYETPDDVPPGLRRLAMSPFLSPESDDISVDIDEGPRTDRPQVNIEHEEL